MSASGPKLAVISVEEYVRLAQLSGRSLLHFSRAWWTCNNCGGNPDRKRNGCPVCKGNGGVHAPAPYVAKEDGAHKEREAMFDLMRELLRQGLFRG